MRHSVRTLPALLLPALLLGGAGTALAQTAAATPAAAVTADMPAAPEVGTAAPDFTLPAAGTSGSMPVSLAALRGKVVVLAFYPKDKTSGCTAELTKFRDEYAGLFGAKAGKDVIVVPVSADGLASHAAWAGEAKFPFMLASDTALTVAGQYGSRRPGAPVSNRTTFVIDRQGRIVYRDLKFNALSEDAYQQLAAAVRKAAAE